MQKWFLMYDLSIQIESQVLGTTGYYMYVLFSLITLYGSNIGTMV